MLLLGDRVVGFVRKRLYNYTTDSDMEQAGDEKYLPWS
jgi:hypothetical protein